MNKKDLILHILELLSEERELAKPLSVLVKNNNFDENELTSLILIFQKEADKIKNIQVKEKLNKSIIILNKLKQKELDIKKKELEELKNMEDIMNMF